MRPTRKTASPQLSIKGSIKSLFPTAKNANLTVLHPSKASLELSKDANANGRALKHGNLKGKLLEKQATTLAESKDLLKATDAHGSVQREDAEIARPLTKKARRAAAQEESIVEFEVLGDFVTSVDDARDDNVDDIGSSKPSDNVNSGVDDVKDVGSGQEKQFSFEEQRTSNEQDDTRLQEQKRQGTKRPRSPSPVSRNRILSHVDSQAEKTIDKAIATTTQRASPRVTPKAIPAYRRFEHLVASSVKSPSSFSKSTPSKTSLSTSTMRSCTTTLCTTTLCTTTATSANTFGHFAVLEKMFTALDSVVFFMQTKNQQSVLCRMKKSIEESCGRTFTLQHMRQIHHVCPIAYKFTPLKTIHNGARVSSFIVDMNSEMTNLEPTPTSTTPTSSSQSSSLLKTDNDIVRQLTRRKAVFKQYLVEYMQSLHHEYLKSTNDTREEQKVNVWSSGFEEWCQRRVVEEKELCDIQKEPKEVDVERKRDEDKVHTDLEVVQKPVKQDVIESTPTISTPTNENASTPATDGKPLSRAAALLAKIRAKEAARAATPKPNPAQLKRKVMISRLPNIAKVVVYEFMRSGKDRLFIGDVCEKVMRGDVGVESLADAKSHLELMTSFIPEFMEIITVSRNGTTIVMCSLKTYQEDGKDGNIMRLVRERCKNELSASA